RPSFVIKFSFQVALVDHVDYYLRHSDQPNAPSTRSTNGSNSNSRLLLLRKTPSITNFVNILRPDSLPPLLLRAKRLRWHFRTKTSPLPSSNTTTPFSKAPTFLEDESFQYNLANHFVNHLERNVRDMFEETCTDHLSFSDLSRDAQLQQLQKYLLIATRCEKKLSQTKDFVKKTIGDTHSFMSKVMSAMGMNVPEDASDGPTFLSAAEKTLQRYKDGKRNGHRELSPPTDECWGCKGPHRYRDKHTKEIICPNKDARGVAEWAARMHKEYLEAIRSRRKGWVPKDKIKFSQLSPSQKEAGRQYFLRQAQELSQKTPTSASTVSSLSSAPTHSHGRAYVVLPILHSTDKRHECKPILPVQIDGQLPHITLVLGTMDTALENCPMIRCLFDTGACLSSGYAGFWLPILKAHPECIADLFTSDNGDYTPIILGGVVTGNDGDMSRHTTQLNLVVRLKLRYETTTHQPITHVIAIGSHVGVNTILGKTFIKSLHCHNDATSSAVEAKLLNVAPFPVTDMFPQRYDCTDKVSRSSGRPAKNYSSIVSILDRIHDTMLTSVVPATPSYSNVDHSSIIRKRRHNVIGPDDSSTGYATYFSDNTDALPAARIRVERRRKGRRKPNVYLDDRGHPDWQQSWEWIEEGSYGKLLSRRKRLHPMRTFNVPFDDARDSQYLCDNLRIAHLSVDRQNQIIALIKCKWGVFRPEGMSIPVLDYECNIDTGTAPPVRSKAVNFGPRESEIMQPMIDKLESINQIRQSRRRLGYITSILECQLDVCLRRRLSLNLKKCHLFSPRFEFVGHDIAEDGNHPAQSKFDLVRNWPQPRIVRDVASLLGFCMFYSCYIPWLEVRCKDLRLLCQQDYNTVLTSSMWTPSCQSQWDFMKQSILSDPCCAQYDHRKRFYLKTDFAQVGMGYVGCQPDNDDASLAAMHREVCGGPCEFLTNAKDVGSPPRLKPICMGSRRNKGYETRLHSHLGEAFTLDWAINTNRLYTWGQRFTAINDCYSLKFVLSYEGNNSVILRVQMRLQLWAMDIVHRTRDFNVDSDYMSKLAHSTTFDPLLSKYLQSAAELRSKYPPPDGYRKPRKSITVSPPDIDCIPSVTIDGVPVDTEAQHVSSLFHSISVQQELFFDSISVYPITYVSSSHPIPQLVTTRSQARRLTLPEHITPDTPQPLQNHDVPSAARQLTRYHGIVVGLGGGHLAHALSSETLPIQYLAASDPDNAALFQDFLHIPHIFSTSHDLLQWVLTANNIYVDFFIAHCPSSISTQQRSQWFCTIASLIINCRCRHGLQLFCLLTPSKLEGIHIPSSFHETLKQDLWITSTTSLQFPTFGDSIDDTATALLGVHRSTQSSVDALYINTPPQARCRTIHDLIHTPFNESTYAVSFARSHMNRMSANDTLVAIDPVPVPPPTSRYHSTRLYNLLPVKCEHDTTIGAGVFDTSHLFPPLDPQNDNLFGQSFGIEFDCMDARLVRPISPYEFAKGFGYSDQLTRKLAERSYYLLLDGIPALTSSAILNCIVHRLRDIRDGSIPVDESTPFAAAAATAQVLFNGATGISLPDTDTWICAYADDPETALIRHMIENPHTINKASLSKLHYVYRGLIRRSQIVVTANGMLALHEPIESTDDSISLQLVPRSLRNIVFIAFHANPIGGHFNAYRTFSRIRLRFFWPKMYHYISDLVHKCAACRLSNATLRKSSELVYNFPATEPMSVMHVDCYTAGHLRTYDNITCYMVGACNMTAFGLLEGITEPNSTTFAAAIMRFQLRHGFFHTMVLDKDSKFYATFRDTARLLKLNTHTLSRANHDPMLVERIGRYLNKSLKIFNSEHSSDPRVAHEGLHMAMYAWNCAPVAGTDISRCLMVTGREWRFPLDYSTGAHLELISRPKLLCTPASSHPRSLSQTWTDSNDEHRAYHRELINSLRPDPKLFKPGDYVFARRTVQSSAKHVRVGKLEFACTGPWVVLRRLKGASYECKHTVSEKIDKFHASHLSPVPPGLVPFAPIDGPDHRFGQLHRPLRDDAYKAASLEGFLPYKPFQPFRRVRFADDQIPSATAPDPPLTTNLVDFQSWSHHEHSDRSLHFPSLWELNSELHDWDDHDTDTLIDDIHPLPPSDTISFLATPPSPSQLAASIIKSTSRLFFISWQLPSVPRREWHLVCVDLPSSLSLNPNCLSDGRYLVQFFICHPKDKLQHPRNQRWLLEYHAASTVARLHQGDYHILRPDSYAPIYAKELNLHPYCQWVNLFHHATYIHGPFEFATINGRKTRDRISTSDWDILSQSSTRYDDAPPDLTGRDFTGIQFSRNYHTVLSDPTVRVRVVATHFLSPELPFPVPHGL
ncbi:LOW QUALITY PROTEIN: hypothetical protein HJC23_009820, partial [Cyclotella cryptica]